MNQISNQMARSKAVGNVLALRSEHLTPNHCVVKGLNALIAGEKTTAHLLLVVKRHDTAPFGQQTVDKLPS